MAAGFQKEEPVRCVVCRQVQVKPGQATLTLERDGLTLLIQNVPASVCPGCGEAYVDEDVTARLLRSAEEMVRADALMEFRRHVAA